MNEGISEEKGMIEDFEDTCTDVAGTVREHEDADSIEDFGDTCTDLAGTVHPLPSASRLAINKRRYAASQLKKQQGCKPCARCSYPCGMRSK